MATKKNPIPEFRVTFEARKGNQVVFLSANVKAETSEIAIALAQTQVKRTSPAYRDYDLALKEVKPK